MNRRSTDSARSAPSSARAAARWSVAFGPLGLIPLAAGLLCVLAFIDRRALVAMIMWDLLVLAAAALDLRRIPGPSLLEITRHWPGFSRWAHRRRLACRFATRVSFLSMFT